jgi:hypothetical protein
LVRIDDGIVVDDRNSDRPTEAAVLIEAFSAVEMLLTSAATSTAMLTKAFAPLARLPVVNNQAPLALAVAVPIWTTLSNTITALSVAADLAGMTLSLALPLLA